MDEKERAALELEDAGLSALCGLMGEQVRWAGVADDEPMLM